MNKVPLRMPQSREEGTELKALDAHLAKLQRQESDEREISSEAQTRRRRMPESFGNSAGTRGTRGGEEESPLLKDEVADFIGVDFFDGTGPGALPPNDVARALRVAKDNASTARLSRGVRGRRDNDQLEGKEASLGRRRQCVVHVESATTGAFFKVYEALPEAEGALGEGVSDQEFRVSHGTRRSFAGKGDGEGPCGNAESRAAERLGVDITEVDPVIYAGCMVSTIICGSVDAAIANANGSSSNDWYTAELGKQRFHEKVILWQGCNVARFLLAWAGWLLHCHRVWSAYLRFEELHLELEVQRRELVAAGELISDLEGRRRLDASERQDLRQIARSLKSALSNVERMMDLGQHGGKTSTM